MNKSPVAVIILCGRERDHWINPALMMRLVECARDGFQTHRPIAIDVKMGVSPVEKARNQIVEEFLPSPAKWLIMLDNDIIPPEHFLRLIDSAETEGKFVFGVPCPMVKEIGITWNVGIKTNDEMRCGGFTTLPKGWTACDFLGGAFLAIRRPVLEAIKDGWFNPTSTKSEDFAFTERARSAGFQPWFNGNYQCDHIHTVSLLEMLRQSNGTQTT
jgi:hypothetical protein